MGNICITKRWKIRILLTASTSLPFSQVMFYSLSHSKTHSFYNFFIITSSLRSVHNGWHNLIWLQALLLSHNHHSCFNKTWNMLFCCTEFKTEMNKSQNLPIHDSWLYTATTHRNKNMTCSKENRSVLHILSPSNPRHPMVSMSVSSWIYIYIQHTDLGFTELYQEDNGKGNLPFIYS